MKSVYDNVIITDIFIVVVVDRDLNALPKWVI